MCFRPADAKAEPIVNKCDSCGRTIQAMGGIDLSSCPFCGAILVLPAGQVVADIALPKAPGAQHASDAPQTPGAPL